MSHSHAVMLIWLGGLGLVEFGGLWLVVKCVDRDLIGQINGARLGAARGISRQRRIEFWVRVAPALTVLSVGLFITGAILRWAVLS